MVASICTTTVQVPPRRPGAVARAGAGPRAPRPALSGPVDDPGPGSGSGPVRHAVPLHQGRRYRGPESAGQEGRPEEDRQFHPGAAARSEAGALRQPTGPAALGGDAIGIYPPAGRPGTQRVLDRGGQLVDGLADEPWCAWAGATSSTASFLASAGAPSARWARATSERHGAVVGLGLCRPVTRRVTKRTPFENSAARWPIPGGKRQPSTTAVLLPVCCLDRGCRVA